MKSITADNGNLTVLPLFLRAILARKIRTNSSPDIPQREHLELALQELTPEELQTCSRGKIEDREAAFQKNLSLLLLHKRDC